MRGLRTPGPGQNVGGRVFAQDADGNKRTYRLVAPDDADTDAEDGSSMFTIDENSGQIRTKPGETYSYEDITGTGTCGTLMEDVIGSDVCYTVRVQVWDGLNEDGVEEDTPEVDDQLTLRIAVRDRDEPPSAPAVTVTAPDVATTLVVTWDAPENTGPVITRYDVQYRKSGGTYSDDNCGGVPTPDNCSDLSAGTVTTTIVGLDASTTGRDASYNVQVRARNPEGTKRLV